MSHIETQRLKKVVMTVTLTSPTQGETFTGGPVRFRILEDGAGVDARFGVAECVLAPGWPGPPQHVHRAHDETFYVVSGSVLFTSGTDELLAEAGSLVTAPIGDPHTFGNADPVAPATLLCTVTPERYLGYFRDLADLRPGSDGALVPAEVLEVMARYATEPYRP
jgi:mannose-6-phosphate isomerase-like protein (cupin superfamily)